MARPISTELAHIYVTGDNKKFLYLEDAQKHQKQIEESEKVIRTNIKIKGVRHWDSRKTR
mgnify:CR=1 FL=1